MQSSTAQRLAPFMPAMVGVLGAYVTLVLTGTPFTDVLIYSLYFAVAVVVPGTLVYRRIVGFSESLLSDVAWGSVTGLMLELVGWAAFTAAGINRFLWGWPVLVVLAFVAVPSLRSMWRRPVGSGRISPVAAWGTTAGMLLAFAYVGSGYYRLNVLPPNPLGYFVDLPWHLGVAFEATRSIPLQTPEAAAEGTLHYHWFADAHFGAASLISGVDLPTIVVRTGLFAVIFVLVATTVTLAIKISRRPLVGALAGVLVVSTTAGAEFWTRMYRMPVVFPDSPTGMYAVGIGCFVLAQLVDLVRGESFSKARWVLFGASTFAAVGSKPSILLLFMPAVCLVLAVGLVRRQSMNRALLMALGVMGVAFVISIFAFASAGGSTIRPSLVQVEVWRGTSGVKTPTLGLLITALVKGYLVFATAAVALVSRRLRSDPTAHLLGAVSLVGFVAAWVVSHPGLSQVFFWHSAIPFAVILSAWGLVLALDGLADRRRAVITFTVLTCAALLGSMTIVRFLTDRGSRVTPGWLALITTVVVIVVFAYKLRIAPRAAFLASALAAMALSVPVTLIKVPFDPGPRGSNARVLAESQAAQWVEAHTPLRDLVATNSHCLAPNAPYCDARSFWLSGYGGRQVLVGGYGVSPNALRRADINGHKAWRQPYHDQALLQLNDGAFEAPTAETLRRLYDEYGVRWLVGDRYAGPVSPLLDELADLEYSNDWVRVYKLEPALLDANS